MAHLESLVILDAAGRSGAALAFGFERAGYHVYATREADDALAMAQTRVPQLVVVAVDGGDSLSFVGRVREEAPTRELPVVGIGERDRREEALRAGVDDFVTRPAFIRDVLTLSRLAVAVRQDGDDGGVVGLLEDYGLYFLVRALAVAGRSGVLELERGRRMGEVRFAHGAVVGARVGRMSGVQAFNHLLLWGEASMSLRFESPAAERRIAVTVDDLLSSGEGFVREFESLAERVGGAQALYAHEPRRAAEQRAQIPAEVMALLKHYDGQKPLIDVVEDSPFKAFDTIKITYRLAELGAISRREQRDSTPLSAQLAVRDWLLGGGDERERPQAPRGVTEAGRRAAEVYGDEAASRVDEPSPADDLLDDGAQLRAAAEKAQPAEVKAPPAAAKAPVVERPSGKLASAAATPTKRPMSATASGTISVPDARPEPAVTAKPTKPAQRSPSAVLDDALAAREAGRKLQAATATPPGSTAATSGAEARGAAAAGSGPASRPGSATPSVAPAHARSNKPAVASEKPAAAPPHATAATAAPVAPSSSTNPPLPAAPTAAAKVSAASVAAAGKPANGGASPAPANGAPAAAAPRAASPPPGNGAVGAAPPSLPGPRDAPASPAPRSGAAASPSSPPTVVPKPASPSTSPAVVAKSTGSAASAPVVARAPAPAAPRAPAESAHAASDPRGKKARRKHKTPPPPAAPDRAAQPYHAAPSAPTGAASTSQSGKLSHESSAQAHAKEPVFDELEEDFFAREAEHLQHPPTVEDFSDLEHTAAQRKLSQKRNWFGLGDDKKKK